MPIYVDKCATCSTEQEELRSINAPQPEHCGQPMQRQLQPCGMALVTKNGNWFGIVPSNGHVYQGGGRPKPKTIGKGHGMGGRRPPPTLAKGLETKFKLEAAREKAAGEKP